MASKREKPASKNLREQSAAESKAEDSSAEIPGRRRVDKSSRMFLVAFDGLGGRRVSRKKESSQCDVPSESSQNLELHSNERGAGRTMDRSKSFEDHELNKMKYPPRSVEGSNSHSKVSNNFTESRSERTNNYLMQFNNPSPQMLQQNDQQRVLNNFSEAVSRPAYDKFCVPNDPRMIQANEPLNYPADHAFGRTSHPSTYVSGTVMLNNRKGPLQNLVRLIPNEPLSHHQSVSRKVTSSMPMNESGDSFLRNIDVKKITRTFSTVDQSSEQSYPLNAHFHEKPQLQTSAELCGGKGDEPDETTIGTNQILSNKLTAMDSLSSDEAFDGGSTCSTDYQKDESGASDKSLSWPPEQLTSISLLLNKIVKERRGHNENHGAMVHADIDSIIRRYFKGCRLRLYGSYNAGFAIENSDINLELCTEGTVISAKFLNEVEKIITREKPNHFVRLNSSVKMKDSYITLIEPENGTYCNLRYLGNDSNYQTSDILRKLCSLNPYVETLIVALRHWAEVCNFHEVDSGGLHSLGCALMVIHFLQQHNPPVLPIVNIIVEKDARVTHSFSIINYTNKFSLPELWLSLFEYYSSFNWRDHIINITSHRPLLKSSTSWNKCWIGIQAPLDPQLNVAKSVVSPDISQFIQMCFLQTFTYFSKSTGTCAKQLSDDDVQSTDEGFGTLSEILEYNYIFNKFNFTEGIDSPQFCQECDELGFTCEECAEECIDEVVALPLPKVDETFKETVDGALRKAFEEYMLSDEEIHKRILIVSAIESYLRLKREFQNAKLELMGSTVNGFGFQKSDLDVCLTFKDMTIQQIDVSDKIRQLRQHLRKNRDLSSVLAIFGAKIPLVQFVHRDTGLRGDMSLYNELAVRNTKLLYSYSLIDERAKILGCAMKLLAKNAGISDTADRSLSSYSYILMVIHYLQRTKPPILPALQELPNEATELLIVEGWDTWYYNYINELDSVWKHEPNHETVAELWFGILKYYTEDLDPQTIISIKDSKPPRIKQADIKTARLFNIQDPFILSKNLGAVMSDSMSVKTYKTLSRARKLLCNPLSQAPVGFKDVKDYLFDPMNLTDGRISKVIECDLCGKLGHKKENCARYNYNFMRGRGRPFFRRGGYCNNNRGRYTENAPRRGVHQNGNMTAQFYHHPSVSQL